MDYELEAFCDWFGFSCIGFEAGALAGWFCPKIQSVGILHSNKILNKPFASVLQTCIRVLGDLFMEDNWKELQFLKAVVIAHGMWCMQCCSEACGFKMSTL